MRFLEGFAARANQDDDADGNAGLLQVDHQGLRFVGRVRFAQEAQQGRIARFQPDISPAQAARGQGAPVLHGFAPGGEGIHEGIDAL